MITRASGKSKTLLMASTRLTLLPQHRELLRASAIREDVAAARGYFSAQSKAELEALGFRDYQQRVPALVLPIHDVHGTVTLLVAVPGAIGAARGQPARLLALGRND